MQLEKLVGPVYDVEHKSGFQDIIKNVEKIQNLTGPVYDVAHSNHFVDVMKGIEKVSRLPFPITFTSLDSLVNQSCAALH